MAVEVEVDCFIGARDRLEAEEVVERDVAAEASEVGARGVLLVFVCEWADIEDAALGRDVCRDVRAKQRGQLCLGDVVARGNIGEL